MTDIRLYSKIRSLPESLRSEVVDFINFLAVHKKTEMEGIKKPRVYGYAKGKIVLKPDFDEPLNDFKEYMS